MSRRPTALAALADAAARLAAAGVAEPRLEARILLEHALGLTRAQLYARPGHPLAPDELARFDALLDRRAAREPLAYLVGRREFYGRDFLVDARTLVPRSETELLVEECLRIVPRIARQPDGAAESSARPDGRAGGARFVAPASDGGADVVSAPGVRRPRALPPPDEADARCRPDACRFTLRIADVGTGSGAVAVSLAAALPGALVYALDLSADALAVAAENVRRHGLADRIALLRGDLLAPLPEPVDLIVANLPYVATADLAAASPEVRREPRLALAGGADGLDVYRRLVAGAPAGLRPGGALLFEIGAGQGQAALALVRRALPDAEARLVLDEAGLDRVIVAAG